MGDFIEFEWDELKNILNRDKHGIDFETAQHAFFDPNRRIMEDLDHSENEERFFCFGFIKGVGIVTVRFTYRNGRARIIGAGIWRKGRARYEEPRS